MTKTAVVVIAALTAASLRAEFKPVKIIKYRTQNFEFTKSYAGYSQTQNKADCTVYPSNINCSGSSQTVNLPPKTHTYDVTAIIFVFELPDGRIVVANCTVQGLLSIRACRAPQAQNIEAEFKKDKAKLRWPVSIDGKKMQSETYEITTVFANREAFDKRPNPHPDTKDFGQ